MAREQYTFGSPQEITAYLLTETGKTPELIAHAVTYAIEDGIVLLDDGQISGARAWEITYDDGAFHVTHDFGYLTADGEISEPCSGEESLGTRAITPRPGHHPPTSVQVLAGGTRAIPAEGSTGTRQAIQSAGEHNPLNSDTSGSGLITAAVPCWRRATSAPSRRLLSVPPDITRLVRDAVPDRALGGAALSTLVCA
jgi:hypothetical protein